MTLELLGCDSIFEVIVLFYLAGYTMFIILKLFSIAKIMLTFLFTRHQGKA